LGQVFQLFPAPIANAAQARVDKVWILAIMDDFFCTSHGEQYIIIDEDSQPYIPKILQNITPKN